MAFLEAQIDPCVTRDTTFVVRQPSRRKIYDADGNLEGQVFGDAEPKHLVNLAHSIRNLEQAQALMDAFYVVMFGPYEGLRVKNWADYRATLTNSMVASLGAGVYQLQRKHTFGGVTVPYTITKPVNDGALKVYDASDAELTATVNYNTGTFTVSSGTPAKWSGTFDIPMTFQNDEWDASILMAVGAGLMIPSPIWMEEVPGV